MIMNFKEKISIYYTSLTPTEKRICTFILDNPKIIIEHSIIEAGDLCQTSKSAMLRFAKKLGYRGYSEFKYAIEEYFKNSSQQKPSQIQNDTALHKISTSFSSTIKTLSEMNYDKQLKELAYMIDIYPYVKTIGIGNSAFCANQLVYSLYSHNKFFDAITDDVQFDYLMRCLNEDYLLILFSVSASVISYSKLLKAAKAKGTKIVIISMNNDSSLMTYADIKFILPSLVSPSENSKVLKQLDNRTTLYFFADIISYYYGLYLEEKLNRG